MDLAETLDKNKWSAPRWTANNINKLPQGFCRLFPSTKLKIAIITAEGTNKVRALCSSRAGNEFDRLFVGGWGEKRKLLFIMTHLSCSQEENYKKKKKEYIERNLT